MNFEALKREKAELEKALGNLNNESDELDARSDKTFANMRTIAQESERVADVAHNARQILDDLDKEFERKTSLNGTDITFLFLATAIQCVRWYILSNDKFRITAKEGDKLVGHVVPKDWHDILLASVPYDATAKGESLLRQKLNTGLSGFTHRYRTLGHDPIMGWIFGPVNIITNSLTKSDFVTTYKVSNLKIDGPYEGGTFGALSDAWGIIQSDKMILPAAIARQALHFGQFVHARDFRVDVDRLFLFEFGVVRLSRRQFFFDFLKLAFVPFDRRAHFLAEFRQVRHIFFLFCLEFFFRH